MGNKRQPAGEWTGFQVEPDPVVGQGLDRKDAIMVGKFGEWVTCGEQEEKVIPVGLEAGTAETELAGHIIDGDEGAGEDRSLPAAGEEARFDQPLAETATPAGW